MKRSITEKIIETFAVVLSEVFDYFKKVNTF